MEKLNDKKLLDILERTVIKILEENLEDNQSVISNTSGTTIVNIRQDNTIYLLFYLYLTSKNDKQHNNKEDNDEDLKELLQKVQDLQQKNRDFYQELFEQVSGKADEN